MKSGVALAWSSALIFWGPTSFAQTEVGPGDDLETAINALGPGGELVLRGGVYTLSGRFSFSIAGTMLQPIVIRAKAGERPHLMRPDASQNIVDIDSAEWVVLRGIELSGGSAGIRISRARFLTIEDCEIHDTGDVALRANDSATVYESLRILRNHIHHTNDTGEGMYLGCNNNACQVANSLIEGNYVHHTDQASVVQGDGIELKEGSYGNIIRDNVVHNTNYPCILTYSAAGNGPANIIERNVLWACGDHGIQSAADTIIRNNLILGSVSDGIAMQPHQSGSPNNLRVVHNTVLHAQNDAISLRGTVGSVVIANNALYAQQGSAIRVVGGNPTGVVVVGNVGAGGISGFGGGLAAGDLLADVENGHYGNAPPIDLFPLAGGALIAAGDLSQIEVEDFNGTLRLQVADVGAYAYAAGGNPGWTIAPAFKGAIAPPPDAGVQSDAGQFEDAAPTPDAGPPSDADLTSDSGSASDAAPGLDQGPALDFGQLLDAGSAADAGSKSDGGSSSEPSDDGCSCNAGPTAPAPPFLLLLLLGCLLLWTPGHRE